MNHLRLLPRALGAVTLTNPYARQWYAEFATEPFFEKVSESVNDQVGVQGRPNLASKNKCLIKFSSLSEVNARLAFAIDEVVLTVVLKREKAGQSSEEHPLKGEAVLPTPELPKSRDRK